MGRGTRTCLETPRPPPRSTTSQQLESSVATRSLLLAALFSASVLASACTDLSPMSLAVPIAPAFSQGSGSGGSGGGGGGGGGGGVQLPPAPPLAGPIYLRDSFGFDPLG